jgi:2'-5' RNA ligase
LEAETRPFRGHLTLARSRARGGSPLPAGEPLPDPPQVPAWVGDSVVLFESHLGRPTARYEPVQRFQLRG